MKARYWLFCSLLISATSHAQKLPLWELGFGAGTLHLPHYRGVDSFRNFSIPFPYIVYRGERMRVDEGGFHGKIFKSDRIKLDLSLAGGIPVSSEEGSLRQGMPELDPTVEIGPALEINLWRNPSRHRNVWIKIPFRTVLSVNSNSIDQRGWSLSPYIEYTVTSQDINYWKTSIAIGPLYATGKNHDYYYEVIPEYATAERPEYHAHGGYSGSRITVGLQKNIGDIWLGAFARYDRLSGAEFLDSPLVNSKNYLATGIAFTWIFAKSRTIVDVPD